MKSKIAVVRGAFLNKYEMQFFEPLCDKFSLTAFGSTHSFHDVFDFPVVKSWSPMDLPSFPFKMSLLNRVFTDAHYLVGLESKLKGFDIVHTAESYFHYTQQALNAKKAGYVKKVVATILETIPFNNEGISGRKEFKQRSRVELDHIIALTEKTKQSLLLEGADPDKITVISHFIDTNRFHPIPGKLFKTGAGVNDRLTILFSGRLESYKGVYELLYAIKLMSLDPQLKSVSWNVKMIGGGSQSERIRNLEQQLGIESLVIHDLVPYEEMPAQYQQADIYVAPSKATNTWEEQYNTTLLEAQACGLPIVTTQTGGIPENVGNAAILIPAGEYIVLAKALKDLLLSPALRTSYGAKARSRALAVHDRQIGAKKLAELYTRLLK